MDVLAEVDEFRHHLRPDFHRFHIRLFRRRDVTKNLKKESSGLYYKCFTIVIYDCNYSGQYYKTRIAIVIDDPSLS